MGNELLRSKERILAIDALRGFAVMGIILLHNIEHFNYYSFPKTDSPLLASLDKHLWDMFFQGKHTLSSPCSSALLSTCKAVIARNGAKTSETGICGGSSSCWDSGLSTLLSSLAKSWCFMPSWDSYWFRCGICRTRRSFGLPAS